MKRCRFIFFVSFIILMCGISETRSQVVSTVDTFELKPMKSMSIVPVSFYTGPVLPFRIVQTELRLVRPSPLTGFSIPNVGGSSVVTDDSLRVAMYVNKLKLYYLFEPDSVRPSFNLFRVSVNWPLGGKYMPHTFSAKYKGPRYEGVSNFLNRPSKNAFERYQDFRKHPGGADSLMAAFDEPSPIKKVIETQTVRKPYLTAQHWNTIPDPPKIDQDGARMNKRSIYDGYAELLQREDPETKRKIRKRKQIRQPWKWGGTENIQLSQAYLKNWAKGGENSVALLSDLRFSAKYKKDNVEWENNAIHKVGVLNSGEKKARVNDDLIELSSKYGLSASKKWFYSGLFKFKTQFFNGYHKNDAELKNPLSGFMAPAYLTMALGMDYKEGKNFTLLLLPFTSKMVMVMDTAKIDQTKYKIPKDKKSNWMGGASLVNRFKWTVSKEIKFSSKMDLFYEYMKRDNQIQAEWEMILDMRINVFLSTRIATYLRYFDNESDKLQMRENMSVAFRYNF